MRFQSFAFLGVLSASSGGVAACVSHTEVPQSSAGAGGGGTGGEATASSSSSSSSSSSVASSSSSSSGSGSGGGNNGMVSTTYPAPFPTPPKVVTGFGPVLVTPVIVPVFFSNETSPAIQAGLTSFAAGIGATPYWTATTAEYGVGPATSAPPVVLTEAAPASIDDSAIQTWLANKITNEPTWPAPTANTVYVLNYPTGTTISLQGQTSCNSFGGYHNSIAVGSMNVAYAVVPRCSSFGNLSGINAVTAAESHEIVEAVTDPYPMSTPAYSQTDDAHFYWELALGGGEVGDLCAQNPGAFTKFPGFDYTVQRIWSNASILSGHDPCVPEALGEVYFNSVPELTDNIVVQGLGTLKGVKIPVGSTKTVPLDLYSEGDTGAPWNVKVVDYAQATMGTKTMTLTLDRTSGRNGEKLNLTITPTAKAQYGLNMFLVESSLGQTTTLWVGLVYTG